MKKPQLESAMSEDQQAKLKEIMANSQTKLNEIMGKLATMVCAHPKVQEHKDTASTKYNDSMAKWKEVHGNVTSKVMEVHGNVTSKYVDHVEPKVKQAQEIGGNVMSKLKEVNDKTAASYNDNVAPHVSNLSNAASVKFNETVVPAAKKVGDKAATTFNETVLPKVKEHASKLKEHAEPKLKELNDKATLKVQEGKAVICTPKVKEVYENVKESKVGKTLQKTYDALCADFDGAFKGSKEEAAGGKEQEFPVGWLQDEEKAKAVFLLEAAKEPMEETNPTDVTDVPEQAVGSEVPKEEAPEENAKSAEEPVEKINPTDVPDQAVEENSVSY